MAVAAAGDDCYYTTGARFFVSRVPGELVTLEWQARRVIIVEPGECHLFFSLFLSVSLRRRICRLSSGRFTRLAHEGRGKKKKLLYWNDHAPLPAACTWRLSGTFCSAEAGIESIGSRGTSGCALSYTLYTIEKE